MKSKTSTTRTVTFTEDVPCGCKCRCNCNRRLAINFEYCDDKLHHVFIAERGEITISSIWLKPSGVKALYDMLLALPSEQKAEVGILEGSYY